jgi:hypothetical protein
MPTKTPQVYPAVPTEARGPSVSSAGSEPAAPPQGSLFEAEAVAALLKAQAHATAFDNAITDAANALAAGKSGWAKDCRRVAELHHLVRARLAGVLRGVEERSS